jgi:ABC-type antimicrobial peptide transport system permease subunit
LTLAGAGIGVALALGLGRALRSLLFELESHDPAVYAAAVALLAAVAIGAGIFPARRAAQIDPMTALREE